MRSEPEFTVLLTVLAFPPLFFPPVFSSRIYFIIAGNLILKEEKEEKPLSDLLKFNTDFNNLVH